MSIFELIAIVGGLILVATLGGVLGRYVFPRIKRFELEGARFELTVTVADRDRLRYAVNELEERSKQAEEAARKASDEVIRVTERLTFADTQSAEKTLLAGEAEKERDVARKEAKASREDVAVLVERSTTLTGQVNERDARIEGLDRDLRSVSATAQMRGDEIARLTERERGLTAQLERQAAEFTEQKSNWSTEFENIATRILKTNSTDLSTKSGELLANLVEPLRRHIDEFKTKVESTYDAESRDVISLKEQIRSVVDASRALGSHAEGLAKALKGDSNLRGRWGELALERILEKAGLTEGREYISQGRNLGLRNEQGGIQRPDIIVLLPEERSIVVDSKVPLVAYERMLGTEDADPRAEFAEQFIKDIKGHIDGLAGKKYQDNPKLPAHDCVLMFVPIEGALAAALTLDPELFIYAWDRRVVMVGPPTLLMTLRTVASIWRYEAQNRNTQEIARLAGELCDKVADSISDFNWAAQKMGSALEAHNAAVKRLATGKGNVLRLGERMRSLGVQMKKAIPAPEFDSKITNAHDAPLLDHTHLDESDLEVELSTSNVGLTPNEDLQTGSQA